ncbi:MAG: carbon storage regulator [Clostridiales bacterium]|nr:carbon storage regulator [Clostridiales bacterium]
MLSLQLKSGEYFTIGDDIVVQVFHDSSSFRVQVKAPRELSILRGSVLERDGEQRPDSVLKKRPVGRYEKQRNARRLEEQTEKNARREAERQLAQERETAVRDTMEELLGLLDQVENSSAGRRVRELRSRLDRLAQTETAEPSAGG